MAGATDGGSGCSICDRIEKIGDGAVFRDDTWVVLPSADRPGWLILAARAHCDWTWGMGESEQSTFGAALARVTGAIRDTVGAEKVYVLGFGEGSSHFHVLLVPGIKEMNAAMRDAMGTFGAPFNDADGAADARAAIGKQLQS